MGQSLEGLGWGSIYKSDQSQPVIRETKPTSILKTSIRLQMVRHNLLPRSHMAPIKKELRGQRALHARWGTLTSGKYLGWKANWLIRSTDCLSYETTRGTVWVNLNRTLEFSSGLLKTARRSTGSTRETTNMWLTIMDHFRPHLKADNAEERSSGMTQTSEHHTRHKRVSFPFKISSQDLTGFH